MLRLYNSLSRTLETFEPLSPPEVRVYACGPTVYDYAHIGNFRFNVWVDVLRRTLEWQGHDVRLVMNITDVDDNTIAGARHAGKSLSEYTEEYTQAFFDDLERLGIRPADEYPRATRHVDEMVELIKRLIGKGHAYEEEGSIYFRVSSYDEYGKLSRLDPSQLRHSGRVEGDDYGKEDARDFALWKATKEGEPSWDTPLGPGRPGWHIECSAMSMKYLGATFDIHAGGVDLMFPHHENEIAQSVAATGEPLAKFWLHVAHLIVDGSKMSKSLGNQYTLRDLTDAGHDPVPIRYLLASVHYRKQLNFTFEALEQAKAAVARLEELTLRLEQELPSLPSEKEGARTIRSAFDAARRGFLEAMEDDLNTSGALGHVFTLVRAANTALDEGRMTAGAAVAVLDWLRDIDRIWGVLSSAAQFVERRVELKGGTLVAVGPPIDDELVDMIIKRMKARAGRDFAAADRLRDTLEQQGVTLEDTPLGVRWHRSTR